MKRYLKILIYIFAFSLSTNAYGKPAEKVVISPSQEIWLNEDNSLPLITLQIVIKYAGHAYDPMHKEGLSMMLSEMLDEGAGSYNDIEFKRMAEARGIRMQASSSKDHIYITYQTPSEHADQAFELLNAVLTKPHFAPLPAKRVREEMEAVLKKRMEDTAFIALTSWEKQFFGMHPYRNTSFGTLEGIRAIRKNDMVSLWQRTFDVRNMQFSVAGDLSPAVLKAYAEKYLNIFQRDFKPTANPIPVFTPTGSSQTKSTAIELETPQSLIVFGQSWPHIADKHFYATYVLANIIGSGEFESRLMKRLRVEQGLAYSISNSVLWYDSAGILRGSMATRPENVEAAKQSILMEWKNIREHGVSTKEVEEAKAFLIGSFPLMLEERADMVSYMNTSQLYDLGIGHLEERNRIIASVTTEDVNSVARRLIAPEFLTVIEVGKSRVALPPS